MQIDMAHPQPRGFLAWIANPNARGVVLDREFDDDENQKPLTAEPLDWHESRHWPALATD
jgi:hypothetical protein